MRYVRHVRGLDNTLAKLHGKEKPLLLLRVMQSRFVLCFSRGGDCKTRIHGHSMSNTYIQQVAL
jgi:hypothetical protein